MLINIHEAGILYIIKYIRSWKKPAYNLKMFFRNFLCAFLFSKKSIYLFFIFIFKPNQSNQPHRSIFKIIHICPSFSHFNFIFSSSFLFRVPPHFSQYILPKHSRHAIHPFIHHFTLSNIKTFLSISL